eukprot:CAMPEP_0204300988 /NCGR_PEP_ID=MMETSP0468-20130131/79585_1 /ASSEMBLY_ACC=CAM_ASM_000383 /TAXON_ID=2969 /ORGANISM="Oxyrrhis marina" /LENGTH=75 /DNA_ID=CAMNT_0051280089 /DNA_START=1 /DNA_END=228 /DNA_ORIENTATION=+
MPTPPEYRKGQSIFGPQQSSVEGKADTHRHDNLRRLLASSSRNLRCAIFMVLHGCHGLGASPADLSQQHSTALET